MITPIWNPVRGKLRVAGLASGSGNTLWKALELQQELEKTWEGSPFEIVAVFADTPDSKCVVTAKELGIPYESVGIRDFYAEKGAPLKDRAVRAEYDALILEKLAPYKPDMILLAGYVWATTDLLTQSILTAGVHPADLSIMTSDGKRAYAGADGVGSTLAGGESEIRSSSYLATAVIDGGPILIISPGEPIDKNDNLEGKERVKRYLGPVNNQGRLVGARTVQEIALGHFGYDEEGNLYHRGVAVPLGLKFESWDEFRLLNECETHKLLSPKSVAVIGASARGGLGSEALKNILDYGFKGKVYVVNRKGEDVRGVKGYVSVNDLPETPDIALITLPGEAVLPSAKQCGEKGVKALAVLSAGFRESGEEGADAERELMRIVRQYNMRLLGPNCMGLINTADDVRLNANMLQITAKPGSVSLITQSGAIGSALIDFADDMGIGFSMVASTGNQPDVTINDLVPLMVADKNTAVIMAYLETIPDPGRFIRVISKATKEKPVIIIKSGRTAAGAQAASSHTGSLAGDSAITEAIIEKTGAIRVKTLEEGFLVASVLSRMPRFTGKRIAVVGNAGGPGTLIADALCDAGFELPLLSDKDRAALAAEIMPQASTANPIDLVATALPEHYAKATESVLKSGLYDALVLMVVPPVGVDTGAVAKAFVESLKECSLPVVACFFGVTAGKDGRDVMLAHKVPTVTFPEQTAEVLGLMRVDGPCEKESFTPQSPCLASMHELKALASEEGYLAQPICQELLAKWSLPVLASKVVASIDECKGLKMNFPVVLKIEHPEIVHKSDVGGVILNISNSKELEENVATLLKKFQGATGVLVQEQAGSGIELILGANSDPLLGHVLLMGTGGVGVEIYKDVELSHVPFSRDQARKKLQALKCWPLLEGYRGKSGVDVEKLLDIIGNLQQMLMDLPHIKEMDINPLMWDGTRFVIADSRIRV